MSRSSGRCDVRELRDAIASGATVVDVREYPEFAGGRVPGSKLVPLGDVGARASEIARDAPVYLICRTGRRSADACRTLRTLGFENVVDVEGGITAWRDAGFDVERDAKAPWAIERQVRFVAGAIVLVGVLLAAFVAAPFVWLSGFVGAGLVFSALTDSCAMGTMLAKLPFNRVPETCAPAHLERHAR
jgi:rhodanese-related sulfurtransferase